MSSNSVCDYTNQTPAAWSSDFFNHLYDYRPNWIPPSPIANLLINQSLKLDVN